ncbi:MAG: hypothetical protein ACOC3G_07200 [Phycisphaeraceae bacterium]
MKPRPANETTWFMKRSHETLTKLLLSKVEYDGDAGTVSVAFRPSSVRSLINRKLENAA